MLLSKGHSLNLSHISGNKHVVKKYGIQCFLIHLYFLNIYRHLYILGTVLEYKEKRDVVLVLTELMVY